VYVCWNHYERYWASIYIDYCAYFNLFHLFVLIKAYNSHFLAEKVFGVYETQATIYCISIITLRWENIQYILIHTFLSQFQVQPVSSGFCCVLL